MNDYRYTPRFAFTVVQHSAFGYKHDEAFLRGLEVRALHTKAQQKRVLDAGGIIFSDFNDACEYTYSETYPEDYDGLLPCALGKFSDRKIDGLRIYVPGEA